MTEDSSSSSVCSVDFHPPISPLSSPGDESENDQQGKDTEEDPREAEDIDGGNDQVCTMSCPIGIFTCCLVLVSNFAEGT